MRKCSTPVQYVMDGSKKILALCRYENQERTVACPFCGKTHRHGTEDGHREAHCYTYRNTHETVTAPDGSKLHRRDGYDLVTIPDTAVMVVSYKEIETLINFIDLTKTRWLHVAEFRTVKERMKALRNLKTSAELIVVYHLADFLEPGAKIQTTIAAVEEIAAKTQKTYLILKK